MLISLSFLSLSSCTNTKESVQDTSEEITTTIPAECEDLWQDDLATYLISSLTEIASSERESWTGFHPKEGSYLLYAPSTDGSAYCYQLWANGGDTHAYSALSTPPTRILEGLDLGNGQPFPGLPFGYLWPWTEADREEMGILASFGEQPSELQAWVSEQGLDSAIIFAGTSETSEEWFSSNGTTNVSNLTVLQLLLHEGFHVNMQAPSWFNSPRYDFPSWVIATSPNEANQVCYSGNYSESRWEEQNALVNLTELYFTASDSSPVAFCELANDFLAAKNSRREEIGESLEIPLISDSMVTCAEAENMMELNEGAADYVSWFYLYELGIADSTDILDILGASTATPNYQVGSMQLYLLQKITGDDFPAILTEIGTSTSMEEGAIFNILSRELQSLCSN